MERLFSRFFDGRFDILHPPQIRRDQGVSLCDCQRQYGVAPPHAVRSDRRAEEEFEGVFHEMPHLVIRYDSTAARSVPERAESYMMSSAMSHCAKYLSVGPACVQMCKS